MSSVRDKLLKEIQIKINKIKAKKIDAANNKTLEAAAFEFFKRIDECLGIIKANEYEPYLFKQAKDALEQRLRGVDPGGKISVEFYIHPDPTNTDPQRISGITIWWSKAYIMKNNVEPSYYIDINQMLLF